MYKINLLDSNTLDTMESYEFSNSYYQDKRLGFFINFIVGIDYRNPGNLESNIEVYLDDELVYDQDVDIWAHYVISEYLKLHDKIIRLENR